MSIENLKKVATRNNESDILEKINIIENSDNFKIAVMGRFSSGKSTLINSLLNKKDLLPSGLSESTARITLITYDENERFTKVFKDGKEESSPLKNLNNFHLENKEIENIDYFKVYINNSNLKGVTIVDTPGLAGLNESAKNISYNFLPNVDLALYVVFPQGFNEEDEKFLSFSEKYISHIIPIINQVDLIEKIKTNNDYSNLRNYNETWLKISNVSEKNPMFFYSSVSNFEHDNRGNNELKKYLFETIINSKEKIKKESFEIKSEYLAQNMKAILEKKSSLLSLALDDPKIEIKIDNLKNQLAKFDFDFKTKQIQIHDCLQNKNNEFNKDFKITNKKKALEEKNKLESNNNFENFRNDIKKSTKDFLIESKEQWTKEIQDEASKIANQFQKKFNTEINSIFKENFSFELETKIDKFEPVDINTLMSNVENKKQKYIEMIEEIQKNIKNNQINDEEFNKNKKAIEEFLKTCGKEGDELLSKMNEIQNLPPEYIEIIHKGSSENFKNWGKLAGSVFDWSLIILPGTQIKYIEPLMTLAKGMGASKNILDKITYVDDKVQKANKFVNEIKSSIKTEIADKIDKKVTLFDKATGFMENLTFKKWGGELGQKIGEFIDPLTITREIDNNWTLEKERSFLIINDKLDDLKSNHSLKIEQKFELEKKIQNLEKQNQQNQRELNEYIEMCKNLDEENKNITALQKEKTENYILYLQTSINKIFEESYNQFIEFTSLTIENIEENLEIYILEELSKEKTNMVKLLESTELNYNSSRDKKLEEITLIKKDMELLK